MTRAVVRDSVLSFTQKQAGVRRFRRTDQDLATQRGVSASRVAGVPRARRPWA